MRFAFRKRYLLLCLSLAGAGCLAGSSMALEQQSTGHIQDSQSFDRQALEGQLDQLMLLMGEIGQRDPVPELEYEQAKLLADGLVKESLRPGFFWLKVNRQGDDDNIGIPAYSHLSGSLASLNIAALRKNRVEARQLISRHLDFLLRLFRDPETRRIQQLALTRRNAVKESVTFILGMERGQLSGLRDYLRSQDLLDPDDWILGISGLLWEGPQHLLWRDDVAFASLEALHQSGAEVVAGSRMVTIRNKEQRLDLPIINSIDPAGRSAYRNPEGRIYIPVEELGRRKIAAVEISPDPKEKANKSFRGSQVVTIFAGVAPEDIKEPHRRRFPETRRKPPAEK